MLYRPNINLLSDSKKNRIKNLVQFIFAKDLLEMMLLFYAVLAIIFVWSWLTLINEYDNTAQSTTLISREGSARSLEVRETNSILRQFNRSAENFTAITPKLDNLIMTLPTNIKLHSLTFDRSQKLFTISGTAKTRSALLNYESILNNFDWLKNITSPISQLLEKENINFEIKAELILSSQLKSTIKK